MEFLNSRSGPSRRALGAGRLVPIALMFFIVISETDGSASSAPQGGSTSHEVPADATPRIAKVTPNQGAAGSDVTVEIVGQNFSGGAYISFSSPAVRVVGIEKVDASNLRAQLQINPTAQPGKIKLYVSNPAGPAAETSFSIVKAGPAAPPPATVPETTAAPSKDVAPEVSSVTPSSAARGSEAQIKIKGNHFAEGAKVSFSNPGIHVLGTKFSKSSELTADIQVTSDAPIGETGLFVINPDESEVEARFEVTDSPGAAKGTEKGETTKSVQAQQSFEVFNLGEGISIIQNPTKSKGTLTLAAGKLAYNEEGKEVFSVPVAEIKEVEVNSVFGVNTGTFHVILSSGKTYNFIAGSLRPPDSQAMVDSLRHAMQ